MESTIDFDTFFKTIGKFRRWHLIQTSLLCASILSHVFSTLAIVPISYTPMHRCRVNNISLHDTNTSMMSFNSTVYKTDGKCDLLDVSTNKTIGCIYGYEYDDDVYISLTAEWNLVCDHGYLWQMSQTMFMVGQAVGSYVCTALADRFGRRPVCIGTLTLMIASGIASSLVPNITWFIVTRFINGLAQMSYHTVALIHLLELFPSSDILRMSSIPATIWGIGVCLIALIGYLFRNISWRYLMLTYYLLWIPVFLKICFLDESLRWLFANGQTEKASKILKKISRLHSVPIDVIEKSLYGSKNTFIKNHSEAKNHVDQSENMKAEKELATNTESEIYCSKLERQTWLPTEENHTGHERYNINQFKKSDKPLYPDNMLLDTKKDNKGTILDILKHPKLRRHLFIGWILWPTCSLTYYGVTLMSNQLAGDRYLNFFLYGLVELPPLIAMFFIVKRLNLKPILIFSLVACSALLILTAMILAFTDMDHLVTGLSITAKVFITLNFAITWGLTTELFPTNLRSTGTGSCSASARIAGMISPFAGYLAEYVKWGPGAIFGALGITSAILVVFLPETRGKPYIQNIDDVHLLYGKPNKKSLCKKELETLKSEQLNC